MASCKSCGAEIDWAIDPKGKRVPVDAGDKPDGNVAAWPGQHVQLLARYLKRGEQPLQDERRTTSHFATCPDAEKWRERGRG